VLRRFITDKQGRVRHIAEYNEQGFPVREITKDSWLVVSGIEYPFQIRIKRLLPLPSEVILKFKEIRPNVAIEPRLVEDSFPKDAEYVKLTPATQ